MDASIKARVHLLFDEAVGLSAEQRELLLQRQCARDSQLRAAVDSLLLAHDRAGAFLSDPTLAADRLLPASFLTAGSRIGPYTLVRLLGEGGYGTVYEARQDEPLRRRVAVKVIKAGMDTRQVIARFQLERQALAVMDHPNIAKVYDAGATESGRPYFVMELVDPDAAGITDYCRSHHLDIRRRLELFAAVCSAIQHAHQKGIIHRDLKPANVLVAEREGKPVPKVIDFGIAKALHPSLDMLQITQQPQFLGTPQYMSPEQAQTPPADVDTRSDIYALGVLLYEMLTDAAPFDPATLRSAAYAEVQRIIREVDPPTPSTRLHALAMTGGADAPDGATDVRKRVRQIRRDLDWVVMRAMEKDPDRRYGTAAALIDDVEKYLANEPVSAGPPGRVYRVRKFARRHRRLLAGASVVIAALAVGLALATVGFIRASRSSAAEAIQRFQAEQQRALAEANARTAKDKAERLLAVQRALYRLIFPEDASHPPPRGLLDYVASRVGERTLGQYPEAELPIRAALGRDYQRLKMWDEAERHFMRGADLQRRLVPRDTPDLAAFLSDGGEAGMNAGHYDAAEQAIRQSIDVYTHCEFHVAPAQLRGRLATILAAKGDLNAPEALLRESIAFMRKVRPVADFSPLADFRGLARAREEAGDRDAAERLRQAEIELRQRLADELERPVPSQADGSFTLAATAANLDGDTVQLRDDRELIDWSEGDSARWYIVPGAPRRYSVEITYARDRLPSPAFSLHLELRGRTFPIPLPATTPGESATIPVCVTDLAAGKSPIILRATADGRRALGNVSLRALKLTPLRAQP